MSTVNGVGGSASMEQAPPAVAPGATWTGSPGVPVLTCTFADPVAAAMASVAEFAKEMRASNMELKKAQDEAREEFERQQVSAMRSKAAEIRAGAIRSAVVLGVGAVGRGISAADAASAPAPKKDTETNEVPLDARFDNRKWIKIGDAVGTSGEHFGELPKTCAEAKAAECDADALSAESQAKSAAARGEAYADFAEQAGEIVQKAHDAIRAVQETQHSARMAAAGIRG